MSGMEPDLISLNLKISRIRTRTITVGTVDITRPKQWGDELAIPCSLVYPTCLNTQRNEGSKERMGSGLILLLHRQHHAIF